MGVSDKSISVPAASERDDTTAIQPASMTDNSFVPPLPRSRAVGIVHCAAPNPNAETSTGPP